LQDWVDLGKTTVSSLTPDDVTSLYEQEWPETRKMLIADHRAAIEQEPNALKRGARIVSAILFGLAKRLAPLRRAVFVLSFALFIVCSIAIFTRFSDPPVMIFIELAGTFLAMTLLLALELIDKIKIRDELQLARDLQATLIPKAMPQCPPWNVAAFNRIANTVGGDIYDFVPLRDGRMAVLFGDASGHGMAAGLVMAVAHAAFRTQLDVDASPEAIVGSLNRILCRTGGARSFFSCCYVLLSPDGSWSASVAGHPPILKIDRSGHVTERVGRGAYPLGVKTGLAWEVVAGRLDEGERLLLHSDGLTESRNRTGREFGDIAVETIVTWHPAGSAEALVSDLVGQWQAFVSGTTPEDDVSIAVIRRS
jgi:hypothetical protein